MADRAPRKRLAVVVAAIAAFVGLSMLALAATRWVGRMLDDDFMGGKLTTNTASSRFASREERIAFVTQYVKLRSPIDDTAFHIVFHDNGFAPSDWDIRAAFRVPVAAVSPWLESAAPESGPADFDYASLLPTSWGVEGPPTFYRRQRTSVVAFERDGVVVLHVSTAP